MKIFMILACDENNGIGKDKDIPWHITKDLKYFKEKTSSTDDLAKLNAVIMGRHTWESIDTKFRPLSNRVNCILTKSIETNDINSKIDDFVLYFNSLGTCILALENKDNVENVFIIGGASIYNEMLTTNLIDKIFITRIQGTYNCDVFFDGVPDNFTLTEKSESYTEGKYKFHFETYEK